MNVTRLFMLVVFVLGASGCATTSPDGPRTRTDLITQEDIEQAGVTFNDAYEIIRHFQPNWLLRRGRTNIQPGLGTELVDHVVVYEDGIQMGAPETLRTIAAMSVSEIEYFTPAEAQRLYAIGHPHGAIEVRTRTR